jgi:hypothetical protein
MSSSYMVRILSPQAALACAVVLALAACQRSAEQAPSANQSASPPATQAATQATTQPADQSPAQSAQLAWARAALGRNPQIEVISADAQNGVVTIRDRRTGDLQVVRVDELAAAPVSQFKAEAAAPAEPQSAGAQAAEPSTASASAEPAAPAAPAAAPARGVATAGTPGYTIERADGQVRVSGPGVSIVSSGPAAPAQRTASQTRADPIICEGPRMVHLDNRNIFVEGNAIVARGGCELYITNSHITASGTGIVVQDATVHVSNSQIEGADGSFDADDRAKLFVRSSTFQGIPKRTQLAMVQDQGGNRWQ